MAETATLLLPGVSIDSLLQVSMTCSFDPLKQTILYILRQVKENQEAIRALSQKDSVEKNPPADSSPTRSTSAIGRVSSIEEKMAALSMWQRQGSGKKTKPQIQSPVSNKSYDEKGEGFPSTIEERLRALEIEINKMKTRGSVEGVEKVQDTIKDKTVFAEKKEIQAINYKLDTLISDKFKKLEISTLEQINTLKAEIVGIKDELGSAGLPNTPRGGDSQGSIQSHEPPKEKGSVHSHETPKEKKSTTDVTLMPPPVPKSQKIVVTNAKDQATIKKLAAQVADLESRYTNLKGEVNSMNYQELKVALSELTQSCEKKASLLEIKKTSASIDGINEKIEELSRHFFTELNKTQKSFEESEVWAQLRQKVNALDNKLAVAFKHLKDFQSKLNEATCLKLSTDVPVTEDLERLETAFNNFSLEVNARVEKIREMATECKDGTEKIRSEIDAKIAGTALKEDVLELESKLYHELDKIGATLNRKLLEKPESTKRSIRTLELQIKKLHDAYFGPLHPKETSEDALFIKKPLGGFSCASCERGLTDLYNKQLQEYLNWGKFPSRDPSHTKSGRNENMGMKSQRVFQTTGPDFTHGAFTERSPAAETSFKQESPEKSNDKNNKALPIIPKK